MTLAEREYMRRDEEPEPSLSKRRLRFPLLRAAAWLFLGVIIFAAAWQTIGPFGAISALVVAVLLVRRRQRRNPYHVSES